MADITWDDVVLFAPELSTVETDAQTIYLAHVNDALNPDLFGGEGSSKLTLARIWLAAHFASVDAAGGGGAAGPVTSESAGGLSVSYGSTIATDSDFTGSGYGRNYRALVRTCPLARAVMIL